MRGNERVDIAFLNEGVAENARIGAPMIYLFNSAIRPKYARNVMNTLYLPEGCVNEYRYRYLGKGANVSAEFRSTASSIKSNTDCAVIFIDRYGEGGYKYHPLRRGKFLTSREEAGYLYVKVVLLPFVYPKDLKKFQKSLIEELHTAGLPQLTKADPENSNDGNYIMKGRDIFSHSCEFLSDDEAWTDAVNRLSTTKSFAESPSQSSLFLRAKIQNRKKNSILKPTLQKSRAAFKFVKKRDYDLVLTYMFPKQFVDKTAQASLKVDFGDLLRPHASSSLKIDTYSNSVELAFGTRPDVVDRYGGIALTGEPAPSGAPELIWPDTSIDYALSEELLYWVKIGVLMIVYIISGTALGINYSKLPQLTVSSVVKAMWPGIVPAFFQAIALFFLFRKFGKKIF